MSALLGCLGLWAVTPAKLSGDVWRLAASMRPRPPAEKSEGTVIAARGEFGGARSQGVVLKLAPAEGGGVTLRDAWSKGFDVEISGVKTVHVPAGRIRLEARGEAKRERTTPMTE